MLCRVCLKESECCLQIFDVNGEQLGIADILKRHFWFQPLPNDSSTVICRMCWLKVNDFHQFYRTVEQAHSTLSASDVKDESTSSDLHTECVDLDVNIKEESLETLRAPDMDITHPTDEDINPLYEAELEGMEEWDEQSKILADIKDESNEDEDENAEAATKEGHTRKCTQRKRPTSRRTTKNGREEEDEADTEDDEDDEGAEKRRRRKVAMISPQDDEMVKKHIPMGCEMCAFVGEDFAAMSKHFRVQHPSIKPYVRCCNKKLNKRFKVVQHAYKHENPDFFKCQECQKVFSDRYTLRSHMIATHAPEEELNFPCDRCPKKFSRKYLLELHRPSHVPMNERTFVCNQCPNSRFASNHLLKIHISMRHRRATNVCHVCAKEIRDKSSFEKHVRLHFEDSGPRVKCPRPDCDRWLKDEENLRQHMRRHNDEGQVFTCSECGRGCKNRRALRSHILYVHSNEVFTCEECNKTFKKAITLREHMAQHTGESLYKCPFCTRTFNSNANMHSHKKKMHPVEWDNWRKTKRGSSQQLISKQQNSLQVLTDTSPTN